MWRVHTNQTPGDLELKQAKQLGRVLGRGDEGSWVERHLSWCGRGGWGGEGDGGGDIYKWKIAWRGAVVSAGDVGGRK